jgi:hypothetical protein
MLQQSGRGAEASNVLQRAEHLGASSGNARSSG